MTEMIKQTLLKKRDYEAEHRFLQQYLSDNRHKNTVRQEERLSFLAQQIKDISVWMDLLTEDEAFVIKRHLFDGVDIPRITIEYRERWGDEFGKTDRTIKAYQRKALQNEDTRLLHETGVSSAGTNSFGFECSNNTSEIIKRHDDQQNFQRHIPSIKQ